jgi:cell division septation protein DedD
MNQRGNGSERRNRFFSDSGELLAGLFRGAEATQEIRKRKATRDSDYKWTVERNSSAEERDDGRENTSESSKIRAESTSTTGARAGSTKKKKRLAKKKSPRGLVILRVGLRIVLLGFVVSILLIQIAPLASIQGGQALEPTKKRIIRASVHKKQPNTPIEKKPATAILERPQQTVAKATQEIRVEEPDPAKPVQSSHITRKIEPGQQERLESYPYSIYLGSFKSIDRALKAVSTFQRKGASPYWIKINLGPKGEWFRVFTGYFQSREEAEAFAAQNGIREGESRHTRYANLIGTYDSDWELNKMRHTLFELGHYPYVIEGSNGRSHLFTGAFYQYARAEKEHSELTSKGIQSQLVER